MDKGINSSVDEGQTLIASMRESGQGFWTEDDQAGTVDSSDVHRPAVLAFALRSDAARDGEARTPSPDAEGRVRLRDPGFSVGEELAPTVDAGQPHTVAFVPDVAYALTGGPGGNQFGTGRDSQDTFVTEAYQCQGTNVGRMGTLRSGNGNEAGGVPFVVHSLTRRHDSSEDGCGRGVPLVPEVTGALNSAGGKSAGSATAQDAAGGLLVPETAATIGERMRGQDDSCADNLLPIAFMDTESHSSGACNRDLAPTVKTDTGRVAIAFYSNQGGQDKVTADGQSPPVKIGSGSGVSPVAVAFTCKDHGQDVGQDVSPTLRSMGERDSTPCGGGQVAVAIGMDEEYNADEELMGTIRSHQSGGFEGAVAFQLSGDRDKPGVSASREVAFALSANPMSDRGQAVLAFDTQQVTCPDNHSNPLPGDPSPTLSRRAGETMMIAFSTCGYGAHEGDVVPPLMASDAQLSNHVTGVIGFERRIGRNGRGQPSDTTSPLRAVGVQGDAAPAVAFTVADNSNAHAWEKDTAPTLEAHPQSETSGRQTGVRTGMQVRRLTPRECERLQGFPDDYTLIPYRNKSLEIDGKEYRGKIKYAADGPRYKALGNSMAVPVMRWIGERIAAVDAALPGKKGK